MRHFLKEYFPEILAGVLVVLGIVLVVETKVKETLINNFKSLYIASRLFLYHLKEGFDSFLRTISLADLIGVVLILGLGAFLFWRIRYRFLSSAYWRIHVCPRCGSALFRVHRKIWERLVSKVFFIHSCRYRCTNSECQWEGLRARIHKHES